MCPLRPSYSARRAWPTRATLNQATLLLLVLCLPIATAAQQTVLTGHTPEAVLNGSARPIGHYNPEQKLRLVFALRPPHIAEEEAFLKDLQDPGSPRFHQFPSETEWNARFAPSAQDEAAVASWASTQGFTITARYSNRLLVDVEAPSAVIEKALNVTINQYKLGKRTVVSNDRDPSIPASLANVVQAVLGLDNINVAHSAMRHSSELAHSDYAPGPAYAVGTHIQQNGNPDKPATVSYPPQGYGPPEIYASTGYDYLPLQALGHCCNPLNNPNNSPPEASIAIAIWDEFADSDLSAFVSEYGLASNVQRYHIDGNPPCCLDETTLDVEWSTAMANSFGSPSTTAEVHMYEGSNNMWSTVLDVINRALTDGHARVLSMSWGGAELHNATPSIMNSYHAVFNQMIGQGWALIAAAGDQGSTTGCGDYIAVSYPASDPNVTAAGGTFLYANPPGEGAWEGSEQPGSCAQNYGGGGGGCSAYFASAGYQLGIACGSGSRAVPDLSLNAGNPQPFYWDGQWEPGGGTSVVAPEIAGFVAQENAYLLYLGSVVGNTCGPSLNAPCAPMGAANPYLYREGIHPFAPHAPFYDTAALCAINDINVQFGLPYYCAVGWYDLATGWGSANMLQLAWMVNDFLAGDGVGPTASFSGPQTNYWFNTNNGAVSWRLNDSSGNGHLPTGAAGATASWDADPGDLYGEPAPGYVGTYNSFYGGPQNLGNSGSAGLTGIYSSGCHFLHLRAWDNSGRDRSGDQQYGPVCFDIDPPFTVDHLQGPGWYPYYSGPVLVTINSSDIGSGVAKVVYQINSGPWQNYVQPFYVAAPGAVALNVSATDNVGNSEYPQYDWFEITSNNQQFTLSVSKTGSGSGTVTSSDGVINCGSTCSATYYYQQPVTLTATPAPGSVLTGWRGCDSTIGSNCTLTVNTGRTVTAVFNPSAALQFVPVTPCRVVDTRNPNGPYGGPSLQGGTARAFSIPAGPCAGIPTTATAFSVNVTAVPQGPLWYLTAFPTGYSQPLTSTLNSSDGRVKANAAILPAGDNSSVSFYVTNTADLVLDINGYFIPSNSSTLAFFPLTPCRVADTRNPNGPLGGPILQNGQVRDFPVLQSTCGIPASAQAYSFNFTVVPKNGGALGFLSAWPAGQPQPLVSTLNDDKGTVTANAAIVPAGTNGDVDVYPAGNDTDLIIDVNGYFAAPSSAPNPLSLYAALPCRVLDTRQSTEIFVGELTVPVVSSPCQVPSAGKAYVMNATVVPMFLVNYLELWPDGLPQPLVSTLNAQDGAITSNMAIVSSTDGSIDSYSTNQTQLILDISGYFAP